MLTAKEMYETFHSDEAVIPFEALSLRTQDRWKELAVAAEADVAKDQQEQKEQLVHDLNRALSAVRSACTLLEDDEEDVYGALDKLDDAKKTIKGLIE